MSEETKYVTQEAFDTFAKSASNTIAYMDNVVRNLVKRQETIIKLLCESSKGPMDFNLFVEGLTKYDAFTVALKDIRSISKMSERIEAALKYNADNPTAFRILADDINVLEQAVEAESISKANYDKALTLPHTELFKQGLSKFLSTSE